MRKINLKKLEFWMTLHNTCEWPDCYSCQYRNKQKKPWEHSKTCRRKTETFILPMWFLIKHCGYGEDSEEDKIPGTREICHKWRPAKGYFFLNDSSFSEQ